jgi:hypothetical protein
MLHCFHVSFVSALRFIYLGPNSLVGGFNHQSSAVEVFSVFRQHCVAGSLQCSFSPLDWGIAP